MSGKPGIAISAAIRLGCLSLEEEITEFRIVMMQLSAWQGAFEARFIGELGNRRLFIKGWTVVDI